MHHLFCRHCGVRTFARSYAEAIGGDYIGIQLAALDKVDPQELISALIRYADGRHDRWENIPDETRHLRAIASNELDMKRK